MAKVSSSLSLITFKYRWIELPNQKVKGCRTDLKNSVQLYALYKRLRLDLKTCIGCKWKWKKILNTNIKQKRTEIGVSMLNKIVFKSKIVGRKKVDIVPWFNMFPLAWTADEGTCMAVLSATSHLMGLFHGAQSLMCCWTGGSEPPATCQESTSRLCCESVKTQFIKELQRL